MATGAVVPVCALVVEGGGAAFFEDPQPAASTTTNESSTAAVLVLSACPVSAGRFTGIRRPSVARPTRLERTFDWYAQDKQGNVWYVGEDSVAFFANGKTDNSGSWEAGVHDAEPGLVMEADPQIPDAHRQEFLSNQAEDTAWIVDRGSSFTGPAGTFKNALTSLEATRIEPGAYDRKVYAPGIGMVREEALTGPAEFADLVSVSGQSRQET